jgi:ankyrin repeat protein
VQLLISYGASLSVTQYHGANLLMLATVTNSELVVILYTANPSLAKAMDERGASVLHYAALVANPETIRFLLDTGMCC